MRYSYKKRKKELMEKDEKAMLILSFPAIQLLDISVNELPNHTNSFLMSSTFKICC